MDLDESVDDRVLRFLRNPLEYRIQHLFMEIPDHFWDPVTISLPEDEQQLLKRKLLKQDCIICNEEVYNFRILPCCNNDLCVDCVNTWFNKSVKCPYCNQDIRELII